MKIKPSSYTFNYYNSLILDHSEKIFSHMVNAGKSKHVRDMGKLFRSNTLNFTDLKQQDISSIDMQQNSLNQSNSMDISFMNKSKILNNSLLHSKIEEPNIAEVEEDKEEL